MHVKDVANHIAPFLKENGFTRKGNRFFQIKGCCLFMILLEPCFCIRPGFFVYPLYYPFPIMSLSFGTHLCYYRDRSFGDLNRECSESEFAKWIAKLKILLETSVFPHLKEIDSPVKLSAFLATGYQSVRYFWGSLVRDDYFALKAYTEFLCGIKDDMQKSIEKGIEDINNFPTFEHIKQERRRQLTILNEMIDKSPEEKRLFIESIARNTLYECLGKNWEKLIKGALTFPLDFTNF